MILIDGSALYQATSYLRKYRVNYPKLIELAGNPPDRWFIGPGSPKNKQFLETLADHQIEFIKTSEFFGEINLRARNTGVISYHLGKLSESNAKEPIFIVSDDFNLWPTFRAGKCTDNLDITLIFWSKLLEGTGWIGPILRKEIEFIDLNGQDKIVW